MIKLTHSRRNSETDKREKTRNTPSGIRKLISTHFKSLIGLQMYKLNYYVVSKAQMQVSPYVFYSYISYSTSLFDPFPYIKRV